MDYILSLSQKLSLRQLYGTFPIHTFDWTGPLPKVIGVLYLHPFKCNNEAKKYYKRFETHALF